MPTEDTPDRMPEKPLNDHHFETPVVRESRSCGLEPEEPHPAADTEHKPPQKQEMAFERRWDKVQTVFVARGRRALRPG
ncbi:MAG: hypothetical protein M3Z46_13315 [Actinomycetota bacterium]|nr:hypothetical protein [Actinomycetota bacterium]